MENKIFIDKCKQLVKEQGQDHLDKSYGEIKLDVYVVWITKVLRNNKVLLFMMACITKLHTMVISMSFISMLIRSLRINALKLTDDGFINTQNMCKV